MLLCQTPCLANFLKRYCLYFILVTKWIQINRTKWPKLDHFMTWSQSLVLKIDQILQISLLMNQWCLIMFKTIVNRECKVNLFDLDVRCGSLLSLLDMQLTLTHIKMQKMECQRKHLKRLGFLGRLLFSISLMLYQSKCATYFSWTFYNRLATEIFRNKQHYGSRNYAAE